MVSPHPALSADLAPAPSAGATPVLDLRAVARALPAGALPPLGPAGRAVALRTWRGRMVNEHCSAQVWASLLPQAMRAAVPPALLPGLAAAAGDELRHAEQCAGVVMALGGAAVAPLPPLRPLPAHAHLPPLEAFLWNIVSVGCISETVAVSLIRAEHLELPEGPLRALLGQILADEVQHARLGWTTLGVLLPRLDAAGRARLEAYLEVALAHQIAHELPLLPLNALPEDPGLPAAGVCRGAEARALFFATLGEVIVPQLEAAGLRARAAWAAAQLRPEALAA